MTLPRGRGTWFLGICIGLWLAGFAFTAQAQGSSVPVTGYAWSSNIGWISMSCQDGGAGQSNICASNGGYDYGVFVNPDGTLSGYAWSSNIGWIQFGGLSGCPAGDCDARPNGDASELLGWARALSYGDGWDGWISLNCSNTGGCGGSNYKVRVNNTSNSYAWGSDVVGWVDFSRVIFPGPVITFSADPNPIPEGGDTTLAWEIDGLVETCYANNTVSGHNWTTGQSKSADTSITNTQLVTGLMNDTQFTLRCDGPGNTFDEKSVLVDVVTAPTAYLEACRWDGSSATDCTTAPEFLLIAEGDDIRLGWDGGDEASTTCQAIAGKDFDTGGAREGTQVISSLTTTDHPQTYTVECSHPLFATPATASVDVHIGTKCEPLAGLAAPEMVRIGGRFTLSWQKPVDIAECVIAGGSLSISASPSEPSPGQCDVVDEFPVTLSNGTEFTMSCNYPPVNPTAEVDVIPRLEEI